ncbi:MAG: hypothetical protein AAFZ17_07370 [Cyanobacteria bacterium J06650_10]
MKAPEKLTQSFLDSFLSNEDSKVAATPAGVPTAAVSATVQRVHCPTCGSSAERYHLSETATIRTQCAHCDYLMVSCSKTGRVIEAYAPSFSPSVFAVA